MKITILDNICRILFECTEKFAGKEVLIEGKKVLNGFLIDNKAVYWVTTDKNGTEQKTAVADNIKQVVISLIVALGAAQGINFVAGKILGSIAENAKAPTFGVVTGNSQTNNDESYKI